MAELEKLSNVIALPQRAEWTPITKAEEERTERATVLRERVWERIPKHLSRFELAPAFRRFVNEFDPKVSAVLIGPTGSGKSTACVHLVQSLLRKGRDNGGAEYQFARGIFWTRTDSLTVAGGSDSDDATKLLHRAEYCKLLILDDLSSPSKTVLRIIQERYDHQRPMVATNGSTNARQLQESVGGEAVLRWILECGGLKRGPVFAGRPA